MKNILTKLDHQTSKMLKDIGQLASELDVRVYLVGGPVRDLLLGKDNLDIDVTVVVNAIRLADTYLMEAEALGGTGPRAQALLDAVRARVGLAPVPVSKDAIMLERRKELAGEGHRWFDLVRTGVAATVLKDRGFVAGKNEIWPIPYNNLPNTKIVQNPNY